jgi:hypothetical protein
MMIRYFINFHHLGLIVCLICETNRVIRVLAKLLHQVILLMEELAMRPVLAKLDLSGNVLSDEVFLHFFYFETLIAIGGIFSNGLFYFILF